MDGVLNGDQKSIVQYRVTSGPLLDGATLIWVSVSLIHQKPTMCELLPTTCDVL